MTWFFQCPFWKQSGKSAGAPSICEGCQLNFAGKEEREAYLTRYCANETGWRSCTIARNLLISYERGLRK